MYPETLPQGCMLPVRASQHSEAREAEKQKARESCRDRGRGRKSTDSHQERGDRQGTVKALLTLGY